MDVTHLVTTADKMMNNWLFGRSECINLICYCSHKLKEA